MDQDEQLICSTKWLVASSAWRAKTAWEAAAQARAVAEKCEHRVRETQLLLNQTDTLLRELEHHLPGFWLQSPPPPRKRPVDTTHPDKGGGAISVAYLITHAFRNPDQEKLPGW
jgi:hypothetical protein